jgi:hypothetical protein
MCQEQSWLLLHLCDVGLAASWLSTLLGPMAKLATVVAGVVSCRLLVAGGAARGASAGATLGTSLRSGLSASARLVPLVMPELFIIIELNKEGFSLIRLVL